ncbi:MAG: hypothetical protein RBS68_06255 [Anaerolineales bacterium]|jgi:hypothetical protein|nr:hypothetical protein [Anaerolineales bacterium]
MQSHWVYHHGVRIFLADFSHYGANAAAVQAETQYIIQILNGEPDHSVLSLTNMEATFANEDILRALSELLPVTNKKVRRRAVTGVSGFRRHFLDAFAATVGNAKFSAFDSDEEAYQWLATP